MTPEEMQAAENTDLKSVDYKGKLDDINRNITELSEGYEGDLARMNLNDMLKKDFLEGFVGSLTVEQKNDLKGRINNIFESHKNDENFEDNYKGLIALADALYKGGDEDIKHEMKDEIKGKTKDTIMSEGEGAVDKGDGNDLVDKGDNDATDKGDNDLVDKGDNDATDKGDNDATDKGDNDATDKGDNDAVDKPQGDVEINGGISSENVTELKDGQTTEGHFYIDGKRAKELPTWVDGLKGGVDQRINMIDNSKFKENGELVAMRKSLEGIQKILENPTDANVQLLQKYIYENLDDDKKKDFEDKNKYDGTNFDGKFGVSTKSGLDDLLTKMDDYIKGLEDENKDEQNKDEQNKDEQNKDEQNKDEQNKEPEKPVDTTPLNIGNDKYLAMKDSSDLAKKTGLDGVTFYSTIIDSTSNVDGNGSEEQPQFSENTNVKDGDNEYYVKFPSNPDATYRVKVANGELCPVATEISDKLNYKDGSDVETQVLLKNNESCVRYLENILPDSIKNDVTIRWNSESQDYVLDSFGWELTIEPMTIAGDWISKKEDNNPDYLMKSLAFLNLTNYIRSEGKSRGKNNPDVNKELKIKGIKDKQNGKKLYIDRERFGLAGATSEELSRYKKYNNHEKWDDNWDKKKENRFYKKIDVR